MVSGLAGKEPRFLGAMGPVPDDSGDQADDEQPDDESPADGCETEDEEADVGECACRGHACPESPVPKDIQNVD